MIEQKKASLIVITSIMVKENLSLQLHKLLQLVSVGNYNVHMINFLNQVCASLWPARDWFLEIAFVCDVSMHVCVSAPKLLMTSSVIWCDIEPL